LAVATLPPSVDARRGGHDRLFPQLRQDSRGRYSDLYQKWFGRFLVKVGAQAPKPRKAG
jgi:hypothetical protein